MNLFNLALTLILAAAVPGVKAQDLQMDTTRPKVPVVVDGEQKTAVVTNTSEKKVTAIQTSADKKTPNEVLDLKRTSSESTGLLELAIIWLPWPLVTLVLGVLLIRSPQVADLLSRILKGANRITVAGLEIRLNEAAEATLEDVQKLIAQVPRTQQQWIAHSLLRQQFLLVLSDMRDYLCSAGDHGASPLSRSAFNSFRFTVHVPDILLEHSLRQLVDYAVTRGGGAGRVFSVRMGIIGLVWRQHRSDFLHQTYGEEQLIQTWGMTLEEAVDSTRNRAAIVAFLIKSDHDIPVALLYGDSSNADLFSAERLGEQTDKDAFLKIEAKVVALCKDRGLTQSLIELDRARAKVPQLDLYAAN